MYAEKYLGFGNDTQIFAPGRILKDPIILPKETKSIWTPLVNNLRRFLSREIKNHTFTFLYSNQSYTISTDEEGYYHIDIQVNNRLKDKSRVKHLPIYLNDKEDQHPYYLPSKNAKYGLISDIDDTILKSQVQSLYKMLYLTFTKNPWTREAVEDAATWFRKMSDGGQNPVFYVSHSPWNIYGNIHKFIEITDFPAGPILLRDYGLYLRKKPISYTEHKLLSIRRILTFYPSLTFYLIGDAAEKDPEFYQLIYKEFPGRIKKIFIRRTPNMKQDLQVYEDLDHFIFFKEFSDLLT